MEGKTPPNDYVRWRLSQGFSPDQTKFLFNSFDNEQRRIDEIDSWLKSNERIRSEFLSRSNEIILTAQSSIYERNDSFAKKLLPRIHLTLPRVEAATKQAMCGKYHDAMILLRSAIEGFLRFTLDLVYEFRWPLHGILDEMQDDTWQKARNVEHPLTIAPMCNFLRRMGVAGPPFSKKYDLYRYLEIDKLNNYTHSNVIVVLANNEGKFDDESFQDFIKLHRKAIESFIIIWQNLSDKIEHNELPIIEPGVEFQPEEMPMFAELINIRN